MSIISSLRHCKYNLVLDLDETLISTYAIDGDDISSAQSLITLKGLLTIHEESHNNGSAEVSTRYFIFARPGLIGFLKYVSDKFNVYVYTNGVTLYANVIVSVLSSWVGYNFVLHIWSRTQGQPSPKFISKTGLDPTKTIVVDDLMEMWPNDASNVINIKNFGVTNAGYENDAELAKIIDILHIVYTSGDDNIIPIIARENTSYIRQFDTGVKDIFSVLISYDDLQLVSNPIFISEQYQSSAVSCEESTDVEASATATVLCPIKTINDIDTCFNAEPIATVKSEIANDIDFEYSTTLQSI